MKWPHQGDVFSKAALKNIVIHRKSRCYEFEIQVSSLPKVDLYVDFFSCLKAAFLDIAEVKICLFIDKLTDDFEQVLAYWPIIVHNLALNPTLTKQLLEGSAPIERDGYVFILTCNEQQKAFIEQECLSGIQDAYQSLGFKHLPFMVMIDAQMAKDQKHDFINRQNALNQVQQKQARTSIQSLSQGEKANRKIIDLSEGIRIGKPIADNLLMPMDTFKEEQNKIAVEGLIFSKELKQLSSGRYLLVLKITDYSSAFTVNKFANNEHEVAVFEALKEGMWIRVLGDLKTDDRFLRDLVLWPRNLEVITHQERKDTSPEGQKRIELHLHSNMSTMDATNTVTDLINRAASWGHEAVAITDRAGVQAFPEASRAAKAAGIRVIYGVEMNLVRDEVNIAYEPQRILLEDATYIVFDVETTGLSSAYDHMIELAAVKMEKGNVIDRFEEFINPGHPLSAFTTELTGITDAMLADAREEEAIVREFKEWVGDSVYVAHNASFDMGFINAAYERYQLGRSTNPVIDTLELSRYLHPEYKGHRLNQLAKRYKVNLEQHHRAVYDAETTAALAWILLKEAKTNHGITFHDQLNVGFGNEAAYRLSRPTSTTILVKNQKGLKDLFRLVSESNVNYFFREPRMPSSLLIQNRDNLLLGTGAAESEFFEALMQKGPREAKLIADFYDFIEIMPKEIYTPLIRRGEISSEERLEYLMKQMIEIANELGKPIVATGDVHYLDPQDKIFRDIIVHADMKNQAKVLPESHFRTTTEMLESFSFLGEDLAYELVVKAPKAFIEELEPVEPLKTKLYTPVIEGAEEEIRETSYKRAREIYGQDLPKIITDRLEKELTSIIGNGFSVVYLISQKLVKKSNSDGYIVGSRGSVGSSFVATMLGITEVNPLSPHYVCPHCHYSEFFTDGSVGSGFDLLDKPCPKCGHKLSKNGHDIPFETFLGFNGDKVPDIDLNFSGEYQPQAHNFTKEMFGEEHVFRAGTISTVADKTAYGYVLGYGETHDIEYRNAEKDYLAKGASGVKRTTGQHPGGIIVIPDYMDVYDFTPVQYPADDTDASWMTTHFDFHSIDANVLKLDILGHDDPTVIRKLQDLSGIKPEDIPMDDPDVYKLFNGTDILGVSEKQIFSKTGTLGIPEFGTSFTRSMLEATHPNSFAELLQISGLSHGTDVWLGNAEVLVRESGMPLSEVIGCRDDIMVYLIHKGLPEADAFQIMEKVRKGKGLSDAHQELMRQHHVPEWYLDSCQKIKYMFPKAHAAAYVINALRVAWFKVHKPLYYYCAYLSVRANDFDLIAMTSGLNTTKSRLLEIKGKGNDAKDKEKQLLVVLEIMNEFWERGFCLKMVDLNKSDANDFVIEDDKTLIAPFRAIPGLGLNVAQQIVKAREENSFISKEDLQRRGKVSKTLIDYMSVNHVLDGLPEQNQMSLF